MPVKLAVEKTEGFGISWKWNWVHISLLYMFCHHAASLHCLEDSLHPHHWSCSYLVHIFSNLEIVMLDSLTHTVAREAIEYLQPKQWSMWYPISPSLSIWERSVEPDHCLLSVNKLLIHVGALALIPISLTVVTIFNFSSPHTFMCLFLSVILLLDSTTPYSCEIHIITIS